MAKYITRTLKTEIAHAMGINLEKKQIEEFDIELPENLTQKQKQQYINENTPASFALASWQVNSYKQEKRIQTVAEFIAHSHPMKEGESIADAVKRIYGDENAEVIEV